MNELRKVSIKVKYQPIGIEEFKQLEREWERQIEDILIGITMARTSEGLAIASIDTTAFIARYQKIVTEARNLVEHGIMMTGLRAGLTETKRQLLDAETLRSETKGGFKR